MVNCFNASNTKLSFPFSAVTRVAQNSFHNRNEVIGTLKLDDKNSSKSFSIRTECSKWRLIVDLCFERSLLNVDEEVIGRNGYTGIAIKWRLLTSFGKCKVEGVQKWCEEDKELHTGKHITEAHASTCEDKENVREWALSNNFKDYLGIVDRIQSMNFWELFLRNKLHFNVYKKFKFKNL